MASNRRFSAFSGAGHMPLVVIMLDLCLLESQQVCLSPDATVATLPNSLIVPRASVSSDDLTTSISSDFSVTMLIS